MCCALPPPLWRFVPVYILEHPSAQAIACFVSIPGDMAISGLSKLWQIISCIIVLRRSPDTVPESIRIFRRESSSSENLFPGSRRQYHSCIFILSEDERYVLNVDMDWPLVIIQYPVLTSQVRLIPLPFFSSTSTTRGRSACSGPNRRCKVYRIALPEWPNGVCQLRSWQAAIASMRDSFNTRGFAMVLAIWKPPAYG